MAQTKEEKESRLRKIVPSKETAIKTVKVVRDVAVIGGIGFIVYNSR